MFTTLILVVHVVVCVALIMIILLQTGKGADIGAVFGGGSSQTLFGSSGATPFLSKLTIAAAVIFMVTSIVLTYFSGQGVPRERSIMDVQESQAPAGVPGQMPRMPSEDAGAGKPEAAPGSGASQQAPASAPSAPAASQPAQGGGSGAQPPGAGTGDK
jgi:preprotein translocase subunit SecG